VELLYRVHQTIVLAFITNLFKKGKYLSVFLFLMACPFLFTNKLVEPSNVPRFFCLTVLQIAIFVAWIFKKQTLRIPGAWLFILFLTYYLLNLLSTAWALNKADALYESQKVFLALGSLLLILTWVRAEEDEYVLVKSLIIVALSYAAYAVCQIARLPDLKLDTLYGVTSFAEHKNLFASFLFLLMAFPAYGLIYFKGFWRGLSFFALVFLLPLLFFLQVRSVYLAMALTGVLLAVFAIKRIKTFKTYQVFGILLVVGLPIMVLAVNPSIVKRLNVFTYSASASGDERLKIWSNTLLLIKEHLFLGVGAGNWQYNFSKYGVGDVENISRNEISFQRPHNDLLWIFSETGLTGFLIIVMILLIVFRKALPAIRKSNGRTILFFSFLAGLLVESFFSFPKERVTHIFLASVMLALLLRSTQTVSEVPVARSRVIMVFSLAILCFSLLLVVFRIKGEYYTVLLLSEKDRQNPKGVINDGNKAISFFYKTDPTSTPIYTYLGWAYNSMNKKDSVLDMSLRAYELSPYDYEVLSNYGLALEKTGKRPEAKKILLESIRINPYYESSRLNMFILEYNSRNYREALHWLSSIPAYGEKYPAYASRLNQKLAGVDLPH
jgi:O-antigen ligase